MLVRGVAEDDLLAVSRVYQRRIPLAQGGFHAKPSQFVRGVSIRPGGKRLHHPAHARSVRSRNNVLGREVRRPWRHVTSEQLDQCCQRRGRQVVEKGPDPQQKCSELSSTAFRLCDELAQAVDTGIGIGNRLDSQPAHTLRGTHARVRQLFCDQREEGCAIHAAQCCNEQLFEHRHSLGLCSTYRERAQDWHYGQTGQRGTIPVGKFVSDRVVILSDAHPCRRTLHEDFGGGRVIDFDHPPYPVPRVLRKRSEVERQRLAQLPVAQLPQVVEFLDTGQNRPGELVPPAGLQDADDVVGIGYVSSERCTTEAGKGCIDQMGLVTKKIPEPVFRIVAPHVGRPTKIHVGEFVEQWRAAPVGLEVPFVGPHLCDELPAATPALILPSTAPFPDTVIEPFRQRTEGHVHHDLPQRRSLVLEFEENIERDTVGESQSEIDLRDSWLHCYPRSPKTPTSETRRGR